MSYRQQAGRNGLCGERKQGPAQRRLAQTLEQSVARCSELGPVTRRRAGPAGQRLLFADSAWTSPLQLARPVRPAPGPGGGLPDRVDDLASLRATEAVPIPSLPGRCVKPGFACSHRAADRRSLRTTRPGKTMTPSMLCGRRLAPWLVRRRWSHVATGGPGNRGLCTDRPDEPRCNVSPATAPASTAAAKVTRWNVGGPRADRALAQAGYWDGFYKHHETLQPGSSYDWYSSNDALMREVVTDESLRKPMHMQCTDE